MNTEQINKLVERFYTRLTQDSYYSTMFTERKVDIELLKERQRAFIARLANTGTPKDDHAHVQQVQERHHFGMNPERAAIWLSYMEETMVEIGLTPDIMTPLLEKMRFLIQQTAKS